MQPSFISNSWNLIFLVIARRIYQAELIHYEKNRSIILDTLERLSYSCHPWTPVLIYQLVGFPSFLGRLPFSTFLEINLVSFSRGPHGKALTSR